MRPLSSGDLLKGRLLRLSKLSDRIGSTVSWRIVLHTLCERYLLLCGRTSVHIMCSGDVLEYYRILDMCCLSYRISSTIWGIVLHTL